MNRQRPTTLGALRASGWSPRTVKQEIRANLRRKLAAGEELFPGVLGYERTVIPGIVNALLAGHDFILLGLRGQAKTRILRTLALLLDEWIPAVEGSPLNEDPLAPITAGTRRRIEQEGDDLPIVWLHR
ncbi:MAG TPA: magnesium chelatase, partial [Thermoanaerobaculia bacterium]|nr:magnesium chelatase [Thermoanaerobaculia bacterium]